MTASDMSSVAAYRNDPRVAQYQDWDLPYSVETALARLAEGHNVSGPTTGEGVNFAIDQRGECIGDVYVGLDATNCVATIGYSLAQRYHGQGLALAAVGALIERLFALTGVHRIVATLDPSNFASARLLETLGFGYEGGTLQSVLIRGQWCDDDQYALLRNDWQVWVHRPRTEPTALSLVHVSAANRAAVTRLVTHHSQERFVAPVMKSLADALFPDSDDGTPHGTPLKPWLRAVEADGELVAFVMMAEPGLVNVEPYLWRLLVDKFHQRRRIGTRVLELLAQRLGAAGHSSMLVSFLPAVVGSPQRFYLRHGFVLTGDTNGDEAVARLSF